MSRNKKNKVYGIIGPSGKGKTTLISILGAQIKPDSGSILVNNIPIYNVSDTLRQRVIAMQMQSATSLRGKLRRGLLFGMQEGGDLTKIYSDKQLVEVLENVGLWDIFEEKDGLDTLIGEGGLNLSGGQRQRLNFASLYLRAKFYQPSLILIEEPTSSLDEISEKAITKMIMELGQIGITLVVAHRLKTLQEAAGILDFSELENETNLNFYTHSELAKKSKYM